MGFKIDEKTIKSSLNISKENMIKAFPIVKSILLEKDEFIRVERIDLENATCFEELINAMRWDLKIDSQGNAISIYNHGLNVAEEELLFNSIADFVDDGSFVEYIRDGYSSNQKERFDYKNKKVIQRTWSEKFDQNDCAYWDEIK